MKIFKNPATRSFGNLTVDQIYWRYESKNERFMRIILSIESLTSHSIGKVITFCLNSAGVSRVNVQKFASYPGFGESAISSGVLFYIGTREMMLKHNISIDNSLEKKISKSSERPQKIIYFSDHIEALGIVIISIKKKISFNSTIGNLKEKLLRSLCLI